MYDQISGNTFYLMFYAGVTVLNLIACCYLLFRRANAIAPDVTSPVRLRRWTAAFLGACTVGHLWYMPLIYLTSTEDIMMHYFVCALLDFLTTFPLAIAVLFTMLQDRRRPLWPIGVMMTPLIVGMAVCAVTRSDAILPVLYAYYLLLIIGITIYMVRATRQYGRWLRDNYADLEHKEVWQSHALLILFLLLVVIYGFSSDGLSLMLLRIADFVLFGLLLWRVETLPQLEVAATQKVPLSPPGAKDAGHTINIGDLLKENCEDTELYLMNDLTLSQLSATIGVNRSYLSQYFSSQGMNYNTYINGLRVNHFVRRFQEAVAAKQSVTAQQLAQECGYRSYSTFSLAFKQRMGQSVSSWMHNLNT